MKKVIYIGYYDCVDNRTERRGYALSAVNKMTYICDAIALNSNSIQIVSPSQTTNQMCCRAHEIKIDDRVSLKLFFTLGRRGWFSKILRKAAMDIQVFGYLICHLNKGQNVIVYHSLGYVRLIQVLKRIIRFNLILEVEEIYADVTGDSNARKSEYKLFQCADAYIFPTELLNEKLNPEHKPHCIIYGTYQVEEDRHCSFGDGKVHIVYAGTFDPRKGGAAAAAAAGFLPANYHVHIIGFGSKEDTDHIKTVIAEVSGRSAATVTYDGCLSGEEYIRFIQSCDIGLSTQNPNTAFNDTSFPSKILSYMANGLRVVSVRIPAIEKSAIGDLVTYYDMQTPEAIAKAIMSIDMQIPYDSRARIIELDTKFQKEIGKLVEGLNCEHCR